MDKRPDWMLKKSGSGDMEVVPFDEDDASSWEDDTVRWAVDRIRLKARQRSRAWAEGTPPPQLGRIALKLKRR